LRNEAKSKKIAARFITSKVTLVQRSDEKEFLRGGVGDGGENLRTYFDADIEILPVIS
jgi:hypothetical protein